MADEREVKEILDEFRSQIADLLDTLNIAASPTALDTDAKVLQNEYTNITNKLRNYSNEVSASTRAMETVRQSLGRFNSATINAITSGISVFQRDTQQIGELRLRMKQSEVSRAQTLSQIQERRDILEPIRKQEVVESRVTEINAEIQRLQESRREAQRTGTPSSEGSGREIQRKIRELRGEESELSTLIKTELTPEFLSKVAAAGIELPAPVDELTDDQIKSLVKTLQDELDKHNKKLGELTGEYEKLKRQQFTRIANALNSLANAINELVVSIRKTQQQFGITASQATSIKFGNLAESVDSYISALLPGGQSGAPVSREQIAGAQQAFQAEFGGVLTSEVARRIAQRAVEEGITAEQQAAARRLFMTTAGDRARAIAAETRFIQTFKDANLTSKDAMEAISRYAELVARNGTRFGDAFARAALEAKQIGVDLAKVEQVGDNIIDNFEGFLESQAELGAMGFGFDTSRLAEVAATGNTDALMRELQAQLRTTGMNLENLNRPQRLALEQAFGMSMLDIQKLARGEAAGESLEDLTKKSNTLLDGVVNFLQSSVGILSGIASALAFANASLALIVRNTAVNAFGSVSNMFSSMSNAAKFGLGATGALGLGASAYGAYYLAKQGNTGAGYLTGALGGAATGAMLGSVIPVIGTGLGALIGGGVGLLSAGVGQMQADDMVSKPGYGERVLVTPTATVALNNQDNVVAYADDMVSQEAGLSLLSKGSISSAVAPDFSNLEKLLDQKMSQLTDRIVAAQSVPQLRGIYMDGKEVGKVIYNSSETAQSLGVFNIQSKATF